MVRMVQFTILGEPGNKSNGRQPVVINGSPRIIKSKKALSYEKSFRAQLPVFPELLEGPVEAYLTIWNSSRRPDLDAELIYDLMQYEPVGAPRGKWRDGKGVYLNDRQVRRKYLDWGIDKELPRTEILIRENPSLHPTLKIVRSKRTE